MSDYTPEERMAARIAFEILKNAEDGIKLFTVNKYYPKGGDAFGYGFRVTLGGMSAFCVVLILASWLTDVVKWVFQ